MTYSGTLTVSFDSEWHCGTGAGKHGGVDRTVALDDEGLPYVPGRTLKGMWRDACERVGYALDDGADGQWSRLVRRLFGDPALAARKGDASRSLVHVRNGHITPAWRERVLGKENEILAPGLRVTRSGVTILDESGTAKPDHLRLIEFARRGLDLDAPFSVDASQHWAIDLLLAAGLKDLTGLGAHRRRGAGRCQVTTTALTPTDDLVAKHKAEVAGWRLDSTPWPRQQVDLASSLSAATSSQLVHAARVLLTLRQPVAATRAVLGNIMLSHDFVPGSTVLPVVARALGKDAASLIRSGNIVVTDAVPAPGEARLARAPLSLLSNEKGSRWLSAPEDVHDARDGFRFSADRPVGGWALRRSNGAWRIHRPGLTNIAHASIDDASQRTLDNGVYTIQAIPVGTRLAFDVWLPEDMRDALTLPAQVSLGRYRDDSYGLVDVKVLPPPIADRLADVEAGTALSLWLTSDACIETVDGAMDTTSQGFAAAVQRALRARGVPASLTVVQEETFASAVRRDSWTGSISLPRPTLAGLAAGSVVTMRTDGDLPGETLRDVLDRGIGQRRAEGFGRCEVLPAASNQNISSWTDHPTPPVTFDGDPTSEEPSRWADVRRAIWRVELQQRIRIAAADPAVREKVLPKGATPSNLGTLRTAAMELASDSGAVDRWCKRARNSSTRNEDATGGGAVLAGFFAAENLKQADALHSWLTSNQAASAVDVPVDLGGNAQQEVASWLLVECVRQGTPAAQRAAWKES